MGLLYIWLIAYAAPALTAGTVTKVLPRNKEKPSFRNAVIMHTTLVISILLSQYFTYIHSLTFPWYGDFLSVIIYILSIVLAFAMLGQTGLWYGLSSFIQQLTMLSMAFLLLPVYPLYVVILLIVPLYAYCHLLRVHNGILRVTLFLIWGAASILVFSILPNIYLIAALHTLFGAILISRSVLYPAN